ncbi:MAG: hypothetical protein GOP50_13525 [Candidatus Heimdallarchaeota archaeon]|nr:hypothetical protein [Candidatus Heimdallarchaeota archaeon]
MGKKEVGRNNNWEYHDVVNYLFSQQFYLETDFIIDRRAVKKLKIKGSGEVIEGLISIVKENIEPFEQGDVEQFIKQLATKFNIRTKEIYDRYEDKVSNLEEEQMKDQKFKLMVTLSVIIAYFQKRSTEHVHKMLKEEIENGVKPKLFKDALGELYERADEDLSLLQNIVLLKKYSKVTKTPFQMKHLEKKKKAVKKKLQATISSM